jgi:hypothetical protein
MSRNTIGVLICHRHTLLNIYSFLVFCQMKEYDYRLRDEEIYTSGLMTKMNVIKSSCAISCNFYPSFHLSQKTLAKLLQFLLHAHIIFLSYIKLTASVVYWSVFLATDPEVRVRFPALPDFLTSSGSGTGPTQFSEYN